MSGRAAAWRTVLVLGLGLLLGHSDVLAGQEEQQEEKQDQHRHAQPEQSAEQEQPASRSPDGTCSAGDERDCPQEANTSPTEDRRMHTSSSVDFQFARSLSLNADAESSPGQGGAAAAGARNRVFGQTWCVAPACPATAALTLANATSKHGGRKLVQGESLVACLDCNFTAVSASVVDGEAVCAAASATNMMPRGVCAAVCQWEGSDCSCSSGCSEMKGRSGGSGETIYAYNYKLSPATSIEGQLDFLDRATRRVLAVAAHLKLPKFENFLQVVRQVKANAEKRFGKERAKAVPTIMPTASESW